MSYNGDKKSKTSYWKFAISNSFYQQFCVSGRFSCIFGKVLSPKNEYYRHYFRNKNMCSQAFAVVVKYNKKYYVRQKYEMGRLPFVLIKIEWQRKTRQRMIVC